MTTSLILWLLTLHYVADFLLQTEWQALNKSHSNHALSAHVFVYACALWVGLCMYPYGQTSVGDFPAAKHVALFALVTFVAHWITDYYTSRLNARLWQRESKRAFFKSLGLDQLLHGAQLVLTAHYLLV